MKRNYSCQLASEQPQIYKLAEKNLCKKPLVTKGEKNKQIYLVKDIYCRRIVFFFLYRKSSISYNLSCLLACLAICKGLHPQLIQYRYTSSH